MNNNINQLKWGAILSYFSMGISLAIGLVYTPLMIRLLGKNEFGLYSTVSSTISMLGILNLGFGSGYIRYYAKYKRNNDMDAIYRLNGLFLMIFIVIGLVAAVCGTFLSFHLDWIFDEGLTGAEYQKARILMLMLTVNMAISFPMSVFTNIINANEKFVFLKIFGIITTVIGPMVNVPILLMGYKSVALVASSLVLGLIYHVVTVYYVLVVLKNKFVFRSLEKGIFVGLFSYTIFIFLNTIIDQINWNIDKLLLARFIGTAEVAVYSVGYSLYAHYMQFSTAISGIFTPRIHRIVNETQDDKETQRVQLTELFTRVGRVQFLILALIATGIIFFGQVFILDYWAGPGYENSYFVTLLLTIPASIALIQNIGIEIQRAMNIHQFRSVIYAVMAIVNLMLSIYLCQIYGAVGSAIGTAISLILANGFIMNIFYQKKCNIDMFYFLKEIMKLCRGLVIPIGVGIIMHKYIRVMSILSFLVSVLVYMIVYIVSMWIFGMNQYEKNLIGKPFKKLKYRG